MTTAQTRRTTLINDGIVPPINTTTVDQSSCTTPPPILFLLLTLFMTLAATGLLCFAVMTDHWEMTQWDHNILERLTNNSSHILHWHLDGKVAQLPIHHGKSVFLVPMHSGLWTLCINLSENEMRQLGQYGFPHANKCISYLISMNLQDVDYQIARRPTMRMQNLSISCSLVCLIILGSAALLGAFGICQRQISAILVTGVMYLLAALFALFTLMIVHFKRNQNIASDTALDGTIEGFIAKKGDARFAYYLLEARFFTTSYSFDLALGGVVLCGITYVLWTMLSKIMRYNPLSALLI
ncbi:uncharacterized protein LOC116345491 [Contarinia nasturtii]|uniref:uncharacterized protein LOC116345491 n=1 Tax=Contarinia nasturtii TaxID=265458 RepID=UPI0012D3A5A6|nr:uncharacterized protein LOC116345491 [Contarinia nasturtii]XP_031630766.1 uncharacterized protein LOC116345491 [Contarinia nasturtii]XP_031630767.1 uncharacterized protein LOC116345491 [Contarinia nasturtii]XP_031630768.1 uncharacterized protein LOC116345491 [Contarinia nasturtii]XP_031630769.1 uncharacterized protein LOC116345491 [Contarinia nasturtii]XP_031630770.1 uncharacterized protein LOC116345491 [Contarinia nasturtii]XP_031630771.1 uncharacterized protein LOC116345491 [Contarinia n